MWLSYWGLSRNPFVESDSSYVALPEHEEATARLIHVVDAGQGRGLLSGAPGVGKSRVLRHALAELRRPSRRCVLAAAPIDAASLYLKLAGALGSRATDGSSAAASWHVLERAIRTCAAQGQQVIIGVDEADDLLLGEERRGLLRLGLLGEACGARATVLLAACHDASPPGSADLDWGLVVRLSPLPLSEAQHYLEAKLLSAGCGDPLFSSRAISRLHLRSGGTPRGLDRLASLCLMAGASRGQEAVTSDLVDAVGGELEGSSVPEVSVHDFAS